MARQPRLLRQLRDQGTVDLDEKLRSFVAEADLRLLLQQPVNNVRADMAQWVEAEFAWSGTPATADPQG